METGAGAEMGAKPHGAVVQIDDGKIRAHLDEVVRATVEETLNALLDAEAEHLCGARKYERTEGRKERRTGSYERQLHTRAGEVKADSDSGNKHTHSKYQTAVKHIEAGAHSNKLMCLSQITSDALDQWKSSWSSAMDCRPAFGLACLSPPKCGAVRDGALRCSRNWTGLSAILPQWR
jgi:hypothetical protein